MKILMLLSNSFTHDPRVHREALSLIKHGYEVKIVCWDRQSQHTLEDSKDGIKIHRVHNTGFMKLIPYDLFKLGSWWRLGFKRAVALHEKEGFDIIHCHDMDTLDIGVKLKDKLKLPLIYDAHEIWPYMVKGEIPNFLIDHFEKKEGKMIKRADKLITVSEKVAKYLVSQGANMEDINIVMNAKEPVGSYTPTDNNIPSVLYIGTLKKNRFVKELAEAASKIDGIQAIIAGMGSEEEILISIAKDSKSLKFLGKVPMKEVIPMTLASDIVYCMFDPDHPLTKIGSPNKFFEALATGRPILASKGTYVGEMVEKLNCGIVADPTISGIQDRLLFIKEHPEELEQMGRNALKAALDGYNWEAQEKVLIGVYERMKTEKSQG